MSTRKDRSKPYDPAIDQKKQRARGIMARAIANGDLIRQPCEDCGITPGGYPERVVGHHDDYDQPLVVRWLCRHHHAVHHIPDRNYQAIA